MVLSTPLHLILERSTKVYRHGTTQRSPKHNDAAGINVGAFQEVPEPCFRVELQACLLRPGLLALSIASVAAKGRDAFQDILA
jgi:hypothetical protein